jgi:hypothetical protein
MKLPPLSPEHERILKQVELGAGAAVTCPCGLVGPLQAFTQGLPHDEYCCPACKRHVRRVPYFDEWDTDRRWPKVRLDTIPHQLLITTCDEQSTT